VTPVGERSPVEPPFVHAEHVRAHLALGSVSVVFFEEVCGRPSNLPYAWTLRNQSAQAMVSAGGGALQGIAT
jgi:hypothetical protein